MNQASSSVRNWLRLEGLTASLAGLAVWSGMDGGWWRFALLLLLPDVSLLGYLWGPRLGAALYNAAHSYVLPMVLGVTGGMLDHRALLLTSALWFTHIGLDRALGYGLKYSTGFQHTHLGRIGRKEKPLALPHTGEHLVKPLHTP